MEDQQREYPTVNLADTRQDVHRERRHTPLANRYRVAEGLLPPQGRGLRVLELGGGTGELSRRMKEKGFEVTFVDLNERNLERGRALGLEVVRVDLNQGLPQFKGGSFDVVVMLELIEHVVAAEFVLEETCRVLKPGGVCVLSTPNFAFLPNRLRVLAGRLSHDEGYHYRFFTPSVLEERMAAAGLDVVRTAHTMPAVGVNFLKNKMKGERRRHVRVPPFFAPLLAHTLIVRAVKRGAPELAS